MSGNPFARPAAAAGPNLFGFGAAAANNLATPQRAANPFGGAAAGSNAANPFLTPITKVPGGSDDVSAVTETPSPFAGAGAGAGALGGGAADAAAGKRPIMGSFFAKAAPAAQAVGGNPFGAPTAAGSGNPFGFSGGAAGGGGASNSPSDGEGAQRGAKQQRGGPGPAAVGGSKVFRRNAQAAPQQQQQAAFGDGGGGGGGDGFGGAARRIAPEDPIMAMPERAAPAFAARPDSSQDLAAMGAGGGGGGGGGGLASLRDAMKGPTIKGPAAGVRRLAAHEVTLQTASGAALGELAQGAGPEAYDEGGMRGVCEDMCPPGETADRSARADTTHPMESATRVFVKAFKRSEAGMVWTPGELRTPRALARSQNYLLSLIDLPAGGSYEMDEHSYGFIEDRFRAVRNDLSIQGLMGSALAAALQEEHVRFMVVAQYIFCGSAQGIADGYDRQTNVEQSCKTLTTLLKTAYPRLRAKGGDVANPGLAEAEAESVALMLLLVQNRAGSRDLIQMQELLGGLPPSVIASPAVRAALILLGMLQAGDAPGFTRALRQLAAAATPATRTPLLLACVAHNLAPQVRALALRNLITALCYISDRVFPMPLSDLGSTMGLDSIEEASAFCAHYGIEVRGEDAVLNRGIRDAGVKDFPAQRSPYLDRSLERHALLEWLRHRTHQGGQGKPWGLTTTGGIDARAPLPQAAPRPRPQINPEAASSLFNQRPAAQPQPERAPTAAFGAAPAQKPAATGFGAAAGAAFGANPFAAQPAKQQGIAAEAPAPSAPGGFTGSFGLSAAAKTGADLGLSGAAGGAAAPSQKPGTFVFGAGAAAAAAIDKAPAPAAVPAAPAPSAAPSISPLEAALSREREERRLQEEKARQAREAADREAAARRQREAQEERARAAAREVEDRARREREEAERRRAEEARQRAAEAERQRLELEARRRHEEALRKERERRAALARSGRAALRRCVFRLRLEAAAKRARILVEDHKRQERVREALLGCSLGGGGRAGATRRFDAVGGGDVTRPRGGSPELFELDENGLIPGGRPTDAYSSALVSPGGAAAASAKRRRVEAGARAPKGPVLPLDLPSLLAPILLRRSPGSLALAWKYVLVTPQGPTAAGPGQHSAPLVSWLRARLAAEFEPLAPPASARRAIASRGGLLLSLYTARPGEGGQLGQRPYGIGPGGGAQGGAAPPVSVVGMEVPAGKLSDSVSQGAPDQPLDSLPLAAGAHALLLPVPGSAEGVSAHLASLLAAAKSAASSSPEPPCLLWVAETQHAANACRLFLEAQVASSTAAALPPCHVIALDGEKLLGSGPPLSARALEAGLEWCAERAPAQPRVYSSRLRELAEQALDGAWRGATAPPAYRGAQPTGRGSDHTPRPTPWSPRGLEQGPEGSALGGTAGRAGGSSLVSAVNSALSDLSATLARSAEAAVAAAGPWPPPECRLLPAAASAPLPPADWWGPSRVAQAVQALDALRLPEFPPSTAPGVAEARRHRAVAALPQPYQDVTARLAVYLQQVMGSGPAALSPDQAATRAAALASEVAGPPGSRRPASSPLPQPAGRASDEAALAVLRAALPHVVYARTRVVLGPKGHRGPEGLSGSLEVGYLGPVAEAVAAGRREDMRRQMAAESALGALRHAGHGASSLTPTPVRRIFAGSLLPPHAPGIDADAGAVKLAANGFGGQQHPPTPDLQALTSGHPIMACGTAARHPATAAAPPRVSAREQFLLERLHEERKSRTEFRDWAAQALRTLPL